MNLANLTKLRSRPVTIGTQLLGLVLAIMLPTAFLVTYILTESVKAAVQEGIRDVTQLAVEVANNLGKDIGDARETMGHIAALPAVEKLDPSNCDPVFYVLTTLRPLYDQVGLRDNHGRIVCSFLPDTIPIDPQQAPPWFTEGLRKGGFLASDAWFGRRTRRWVSVLTYPVRNESNAVAGLVIMPLDLAELQNRNLSQFSGNYAAAVFDRRGHFLMRSRDQEKWVGKSSATSGHSAKERRAFPAVGEMAGVDGINRLRASAEVPGTDWVVVVGVPKADIVAAATRKTEPIILSGLLLLVGTLGLVHLLAQKISRPIRLIGSAARAVANGDITVRVEPSGSIELRDVANEFNRMLEAKVLLDRETHEHQQWASNIIENASDLIVIIDVNGVIKYVSPSLRYTGGYEADEALGRKYLDFIHPDEVKPSLADLQAVIQTRNAVRLAERRFRHKDGRWVALESIAKNALDDPTISGIIINARDVTEHKRIEETLKETEYRLNLALEASGFAVWDYDFTTGDVRFSQQWWPILGYAEDEIPLRIEAWERLTHPEDAGRVKAALASHMKGVTSTLDAEYRMRAKGGEWRWIRTVGRVVERDASGRALRGTGTHADITLRKEQDERIARLSRIHRVLSRTRSAIVRIRERDALFKETCRIAVEQGGFGIAWIGKLDPATMDVRPVAWAGIDALGYEELKATARADVPLGHGVVGRAMRQKIPVACNDMTAEPDVGSEKRRESLRLGYRSDIALPLFEEGSVTGTLTLYAKERDFFTEDEIGLLTDLAGDVSLALDFMAKDEKLSYLAYYDALTGAANRNLLNDRLAQVVMQAHRYDHVVAVAVLNLDHFKLVNNSLGLAAGDDVLKKCVARMRSCVRESDTVARLGGDEFVLVLPAQSGPTSTSLAVSRVAKASSAPEVVEILQRILKSISDPVMVGERELNLTCSIGVSLYPHDGDAAEALLKNAAAALSRAKQLGRQNYQFYTPELNARVAEELSLHSSLRRALERDEFTLYYQPKISLQTGRISGSEALLRWNKPGEGIISPSNFIPVLEETGLIIDVGRWIMEKAQSTWRQWRTQHAQPPRIAVNVSQLQLAQTGFASIVEQIIKNDEPGFVGLDFEITESLIMQDIEANIATLKAIRELGVKFAIDDFGTGYSSLSYLARLPVDTLKIDRAFISGMDTSPDSLTLVTSIISLAHSLRLKVVAEGVETAEQVKILRLLKCDEIQGYAVCRPLPDDQFGNWWKTYQPESYATKGRGVA